MNPQERMSKLKTSGISLKYFELYSTWETSNWYVFWHGLSGDELKKQIVSIFYYPSGDERSWDFTDVDAAYKMGGNQGIKDWLVKIYGNPPAENPVIVDIPDEELEECVGYIRNFMDDAKLEYTGRPYRW